MTTQHLPIYHRRDEAYSLETLPMTPTLAILTAAFSFMTLLWGGGEFILAQVTDPTTAGAWPFYGVLIVAIIVLFCTLVFAFKWFVTHWMRKQEEIAAAQLAQGREQTAVNREIIEVMRKNTEVTQKQNEWFDQFAKDSIKHVLSGPYQPRKL